MADSPASLDKWRDYFRTASSDIFEIIERAIMVAASDCPYEFKLKRDRIAEVLFACKATKCVGCGDRVELAVPTNGGDGSEKSEDKYKSGIEAGGSKDTKESKVNSSSRDDDDDDDDRRGVMEMNGNHVSNYSYGDAEALTDEIEEESMVYEEVLRIKETIDNNEEEPDDAFLFDSLRKLQLMPLSVETLKNTEIGKSVNSLRKHGSKEIRNLARTLIEDWKVMVDSWVNATASIAEIATESVKTSVVEEEEAGLPSPPLDEGVFFATPTSMELSQFFDGMDDDGNPRNSGEFNKYRESGRKPSLECNRKAESPDDSLALPKDRKAEQRRNQNQESLLKKQTPPSINKPNRPPSGESGPGRPKPPSSESGPGRPKPALKPKSNNEIKAQQKPTLPRKPMLPQQEKLNSNNEASVRMKLEAAKRKLQERYQEVENAKKQRTVQVVELRDLPKQGLAQRNHHMKPGNNNRNWANGRR